MYWSPCVNKSYHCFFSLPSYTPLISLLSYWYFPPRTTSCFLYLLLCLLIIPPTLHLLFLTPVNLVPPAIIPVTSTERPSMRTLFWRLRGVDSWNSSSLSPKASSHLKVSATSKVRSPAPAKGAIFFPSIHVCEWAVCMCESEFISVIAWMPATAL